MAKKNTPSADVTLPDLLSTGIDPAFESELFASLRQVPDITNYLRMTMAEDMKRHFNATSPMEQLLAKGAFLRMKYLLTKIQEKNSVAQKNKQPKRVTDIGGRYG